MMNIKQVLGTAMLVFPFAVTSIPSQASALEVIVNPHSFNRHVQTIAQRPLQVRRYAPPVKKKILVAGHWEKTNHGRRWVAAHYIYK